MCHGGCMFAPTKTWHRWHQRMNTTQEQYSIFSALAALALPVLIMSKYDRIEEVLNFLWWLKIKLKAARRPRKLLCFLRNLRPGMISKYGFQRMKAGKGKIRNHHHVQCRGLCIIYKEGNGITKGFRSIHGITVLNVNKLNILKLAPGGHVRRFCIWTESVFWKLSKLYDTFSKAASLKSNYNLPMPKMINTDLSRILRSPEIQRVLHAPHKKIHHSPKEESPEKPENCVEAKPILKTMHQNTVLPQARNHKLWVDRTAGALEAKSDEKEVAGKKSVVGKKRKKAVGPADTKKPAAYKKPAEKKSPTEEKKPLAATKS
uniref:Large ribosomal subunit protein uL4 C-terminal domain-containing protein n=1 Tax=Prolemur simus TaxID=1328070 RepID=A0A8C8Z9X4_PROSS